MSSIEHNFTAKNQTTSKFSDKKGSVEHWNTVRGIVVFDTQIYEVKIWKSENDTQNKQYGDL